jgi:PAS domain S-box-containing protein
MYSQLVAALLQQKDGNGINATPGISVENIFGGVQFLSPVYNNKNEVTDFGYAWLIMPRHAYSGNATTGKSVSEAGIVVKQFQLIRKFIGVFNTEEPLVYNITDIGEHHTITLRVQKFDGGLLLWQENISEPHTEETGRKINFHKALESAPDFIYIISAEGQKITYLNASAKKYLGDFANNKNISFEDFTHPDDNLRRRGNINSFISGAVTTTYESQLQIRQQDGNYHFFDLREKILLPDGDGMPTQIIGIGREIVQTDQPASIKNKVSEENDGTGETDESVNKKKYERSYFLERLTEATPDIVFLMDLNTKELLYSNRSVPLLLGYTPAQAEAMEHPIFDCMYPADLPAMMKHLEDFKTAKDGEIREIEYRLVDGKGILHWYCDRNTIFKKNAAGEVTEKIGMAQEITKRKLQDSEIAGLNDALLFKNTDLEAANEELNAFNNVAANQYKETLRNLYTSMEFIITNDAKSLSNEGRANLRRSQSAIQKMKLFTEDIVAFSAIRNTDKHPVPADLDEELRKVLAEQEPKIASAELSIQYDKLPVITGYPEMIALLFSHLISNAIKFRNENATGRQLEIRYEKKPGFNKVHHSEEMHFIYFTDNGIGFSNESSNDIFSLFFQLNKESKYKGSGIGLAVCKKIMDLHKGTISAEGRPGEGATITCCFPV